jgi:hypothetical protein
MASERQSAKSSITARKTDEPELDATIHSAQSLAHELNIKIEENRHQETMHRASLGAIGRFLGSEAPTSVAFIAVCAGLVSFLACLGFAFYNSTNSDFWGKQAERSLAFTMSALSFIFGKSIRKKMSRWLRYEDREAEIGDSRVRLSLRELHSRPI